VRAVATTKNGNRWNTQPTVFDVPVRVYGRGGGDGWFHKEALVLFANPYGGLLLLNAPVCNGQVLLLTNTATTREQSCRVVYMHDRGSRIIEVGFEFSYPALDFWQVPKVS
jgi:hypothetical protein